MHQYARLKDWLITGEENNAEVTTPILEITLPLHVAEEEKLQGIAQLVFDGHDTLDDIDQLEKQITTQSLFVFAAGAGLIALVLGLSFRSLNQSHNRLIKRTVALNEANQALALSSKTTAIGGITSHLMHGLRNPLAALKTQLSDSAGSSLNQEGLEAVSRREDLVDDVLRTLREYQGGIVYQITMNELLCLFENKFSPVAKKHLVNLRIEASSEHELENKEASLILLIIENLAHNAVEACSAGGELTISATDSRMIKVSDNGSGLPRNPSRDCFNREAHPRSRVVGLVWR